MRIQVVLNVLDIFTSLFPDEETLFLPSNKFLYIFFRSVYLFLNHDVQIRDLTFATFGNVQLLPL